MHIAIIMDGNGRWALQRGLPRCEGHRAGADAVDRIVEAATRHRVGTLTLYALSADNWRRPKDEVNALLELLRRYLFSQSQRCLEHSIRLNVIGRRDRLTPSLQRAVEWSEQLTAQCSGMHLRLAVDYSSQRSLMAVAGQLKAGPGTEREDFLQALAKVNHSSPAAPEVDLLIRTGGEQRLSDFLLFESAYAELYFSDRLWPEFSEQDFGLALSEFAKRERRFGRIHAHEVEVVSRV
jgi:undecaprenyl diphosphate synthase